MANGSGREPREGRQDSAPSRPSGQRKRIRRTAATDGVRDLGLTREAEDVIGAVIGDVRRMLHAVAGHLDHRAAVIEDSGARDIVFASCSRARAALDLERVLRSATAPGCSRP